MCEMCVGWSRCRVSKPGQAPPPPGGPAAWLSGSSGPSGVLQTGGAWSAVVLASSISALRSVQNSPCLASWW